MLPTLLIHIDSGIATLTLNRPEKHNALNEALVRAMTAQLQKIKQNPTVRVVLLQANGKDFCAGADLPWLMGTGMWEKDSSPPHLLKKLMQSLQQLNKPTIALVQGNSYGGGLGLIACCDIAISARAANFCFSEVKWGLIPAIIAPYCIAAMGRRAAQYYFLTAASFGAEKAQQLGLVQQIVHEQDLQTSGQTLAKTLLANSPQAMSAAKRLINDYCLPDLNGLADESAQRLIGQQASADAQEGLKAFIEKRKPNWLFAS